jgi:hypothetical protein
MTADETLQIAENKVSQFLNGGSCSISQHTEASMLEQLIMMRQLKLLHPHLSTHPLELEMRIRMELKKLAREVKA